MINRQHVKNTFAEYTDRYNSSDIKVKLKIDHTYRVAKIADRIAESLHLTGLDRDIAWLLGMLHDVGRFEQLRRFHTFIDADSVNHAALSADILFKEGHIRDYIDDLGEDALIEKAIRLHNVYKLPESLTIRELLFVNLLRDADKIDILKVNCDIPFDEIYDCSMDTYIHDKISDEVLNDALSKKNVDRTHSKTTVDKLVCTISFVFGIAYPESIRCIKEQGYLDEMMNFKSKNPETSERMTIIRSTVHDYMNSRL
ncbi:MAG: HD domain-containing protein [Lachnospiraceae bacterium]|nr:HD domain-containing protein [Lachnospiraceae bacterium]